MPRVGDVIEYTTFFGDLRTVRVEGVEAEIKNGQPGFYGVLLDAHGEEAGLNVWGYDYQIVRTVRS